MYGKPPRLVDKAHQVKERCSRSNFFESKTVQIGEIDEQPYYDPWIGGDYASRKRRLANGELFSGANWFLHILAESHYADPEEQNRDLTKQVVCRWAFPGGPDAIFFNRALQAVNEADYYSVDRSTWSDVAYSNYVQSPLNASRIAPNAGQWSEAAKCFVAQLAITQPRVLLVLGKRVWDRLTDSIGERVPPLHIMRTGRTVDDAWVYPVRTLNGVHFTVAVWAYHPSSGKFDGQAAHDRVIAADMAYDNLTHAYRQEIDVF